MCISNITEIVTGPEKTDHVGTRIQIHFIYGYYSYTHDLLFTQTKQL